MEAILNEIRLAFSDSQINAKAGGVSPTALDTPKRMCFGENEEFFLELPQEVEIPSFPIHHDVRNPEPSPIYLASLRLTMERMLRLFPATFRDLSHLFEPSETLKPAFYHLYRVQNAVYLYILRLDLLNRPLETNLVKAGTNSTTPVYTTRRIYMESELIPLESIEREDNRIHAFRVRQLISNTWIGETGKGYQVRGIWMDSDLSKFFSKLFLPEGKRVHPFLPFFCKYKTVCAFVPVPEAASRKRALPVLHRALEFLRPEMGHIEAYLKNHAFSEADEDFRTVRDRIPSAWRELYRDVSVSPYLNARDRKEYELVYPTS